MRDHEWGFCPTMTLSYRIEPTGFSTWTITRLRDGAQAFLQGDDAAEFGDELDKLEPAGYDALCEQYDSVFEEVPHE